MFQSLSLYLIVGLLALVIVIGGSFAVYHRIKSAEVALLTQQNAVLSYAVEEQSRTISTMQEDAKRLAQSNKSLADRIAETETKFVDEWSAINALDLASDEAIANTEALEKKINDAFATSIDQLRQATSKDFP
ncbi:hypothetical protein [Ensifer canadensis]